MEFRCGRIVTAKPPRRRHYGEIRYGVPDELPRDAALAASYGGQSREQPKAASRDLAQRTELIRQFTERTLREKSQDD